MRGDSKKEEEKKEEESEVSDDDGDTSLYKTFMNVNSIFSRPMGSGQKKSRFLPELAQEDNEEDESYTMFP